MGRVERREKQLGMSVEVRGHKPGGTEQQRKKGATE
jgi:hypothetical protein